MSRFAIMRRTRARGGGMSLHQRNSLTSRTVVILVLVWTLPGLAAISLTPGQAAAVAALAASCRAEQPVKPGQQMLWKAEVSGASGTVTYSWSGTEGLTGNAAETTKSYSSVGPKSATVAVTDGAGVRKEATCSMNVIPASYSEPPSLTPVLWVPKGVDPRPMALRLERVWRYIRIGYFRAYGKTVKLQRLKTVVSTRTEQEICGGDCTDAGRADDLVAVALREARATIGGVIPYTRAMHVLVWGAGGWAGSWGWDNPQGASGDFAIAPAAGLRIPRVEPDVADWFAVQFGSYHGGIWSGIGTMAHEANHALGADEPHDFSLETPPNDYEKRVTLAGPFFTETPVDRTAPRVKIAAPTGSARLSGIATVKVNATDQGGMDAVALTVDNQLWAIDTLAPYSLAFDTRRVGFGRHRLEVIAYDRTGNTASAVRSVVVRNQLRATKCPRDYPVGTFHACFYDGIGFQGRFLGALDDHPFPLPAVNAGWGLRHEWNNEEIAFGQTETVSGVWTGTLDFPRANYIVSGGANDGVRLYLNGRLVVDTWKNPDSPYSVVASLAGRTRVRVEWFESDGTQALTLRWRPTRRSPTGG